MEIKFNDWKIKVCQAKARQYDNNVWSINLTGDLPDGWNWQALLSKDDNLDIIDLPKSDGGFGALLTASQLSLSGYHTIQIRGIKGEQVRHTNLTEFLLPRSLSGDEKWPEVPTEFSQIENRITEKAQKVEDAVVHSPVISDAGTWLVWDFDKSAYVDTGIAASGGGASENAVLYTEQELTDGQKAQARKNIGAADEAGVGAHTTSWLLENYPDKVKLDESTSTLTIYIGSTDDRNIPFGDYVFNERYEYLSFRTISDDGKTSNNIVRSGVLSNFNSNFSFTCKSKAKSGEFPLYGLTIGGYTYCNFTVDSNGALHIESTRTLTDTTSVLTRTNKSAYTPTSDYHPATKKYVDDAIPTALPSPYALTFTGAVSGSYDGSEGLTVEIPQGGEKWEKIADVTLTKDVGWYILANMGMYRKVKVLLDRPSYISGLNKNVWLRLDGGARQITICYLSAEYGYLHWEVEAEVTEIFAISKKITTNNRESADPVKSTGTTLLGATSPSDLDVTLSFTDTSVIQDGDTVTVLGVRR